jgi:hypothetical protein
MLYDAPMRLTGGALSSAGPLDEASIVVRAARA